MGTWRTEAKSIGFNASQLVKNKVESLKSQLGNVVKRASVGINSFATLGNTNGLIGINATQIKNMRGAIKTYVTELESHLDTVNATASTAGAFKGEFAVAVTDYVTAVTFACKAVISELTAFSDLLVKVEQAYASKDETLASSITSSAKEVESNYQTYQEQF